MRKHTINSVELEGIERNPSIRNNRFNRGGLLTINREGVRTIVVGSTTNFIVSRPPLVTSTLGGNYIDPVPYEPDLEPAVISNKVLENQQDYQELDNIAASNPLYKRRSEYYRTYKEGVVSFGELEIVHYDTYENNLNKDAYYIHYSSDKDLQTMERLRTNYSIEKMNFENEMYKQAGYNRGALCIPCTDQLSTVNLNMDITQVIKDRVENLFQKFYGSSPDRQFIDDVKNSSGATSTTRPIEVQFFNNVEN